jgi:DNA replication protein DnaC
MIDRLVHHGHLLMFESKSYRMTHALMRHTAVTETSNGKGTP